MSFSQAMNPLHGSFHFLLCAYGTDHLVGNLHCGFVLTQRSQSLGLDLSSHSTAVLCCIGVWGHSEGICLNNDMHTQVRMHASTHTHTLTHTHTHSHTNTHTLIGESCTSERKKENERKIEREKVCVRVLGRLPCPSLPGLTPAGLGPAMRPNKA